MQRAVDEGVCALTAAKLAVCTPDAVGLVAAGSESVVVVVLRGDSSGWETSAAMDIRRAPAIPHAHRLTAVGPNRRRREQPAEAGDTVDGDGERWKTRNVVGTGS